MRHMKHQWWWNEWSSFDILRKNYGRLIRRVFNFYKMYTEGIFLSMNAFSSVWHHHFSLRFASSSPSILSTCRSSCRALCPHWFHVDSAGFDFVIAFISVDSFFMSILISTEIKRPTCNCNKRRKKEKRPRDEQSASKTQMNGKRHRDNLRASILNQMIRASQYIIINVVMKTDAQWIPNANVYALSICVRSHDCMEFSAKHPRLKTKVKIHVLRVLYRFVVSYFPLFFSGFGFGWLFDCLRFA